MRTYVLGPSSVPISGKAYGNARRLSSPGTNMVFVVPSGIRHRDGSVTRTLRTLDSSSFLSYVYKHLFVQMIVCEGIKP
jgi:hypothetical protein